MFSCLCKGNVRAIQGSPELLTAAKSLTVNNARAGLCYANSDRSGAGSFHFYVGSTDSGSKVRTRHGHRWASCCPIFASRIEPIFASGTGECLKVKKTPYIGFAQENDVRSFLHFWSVFLYKKNVKTREGLLYQTLVDFDTAKPIFVERWWIYGDGPGRVD